MAISRDSVFTLTATLISVLVSAPLYASPLPFGVVGSPIDLSANVSESILPGGTVFQDSKPLFGTEPDPKQSAELLHLSEKGVNASGRSTNIDQAFASSLAESNGNGGVGVSQTIFGSPGNTGQNVVRQLVAQSLWTQTFVYNGSPKVEITLHLQIPALQVQLFGVPPNRDNQSFTETATASATVHTVITHADGSFSHGGSFDFGLREFETQIPDGTGTFLNFGDVDLIGTDGPLFATLRPNFVGAWNIDAVSTDVRAWHTPHGRHAGVCLYAHSGGHHARVRARLRCLPRRPLRRGRRHQQSERHGRGLPSAVPEPGTWMLLLPGLAGLGGGRTRHVSQHLVPADC